jgi:hypothetical protein
MAALQCAIYPHERPAFLEYSHIYSLSTYRINALSFRMNLSKALALIAGAVTLKDCGVDTAVFTINSMSMIPPVATPGLSSQLYLEYVVPAGTTITDGTTKYEYSFNGIPFTPVIEPLCQNVPCPLGPGLYPNTSQVDWPTGVSGKVKTRMSWLDLDSTILLCLDTTASL